MGIGIGGEDSEEAGAGAGGGATRGTGKPWRGGAAVGGSWQWHLRIAGGWGGRVGEGERVTIDGSDRAASHHKYLLYKPTT